MCKGHGFWVIWIVQQQQNLQQRPKPHPRAPPRPPPRPPQQPQQMSQELRQQQLSTAGHSPAESGNYFWAPEGKGQVATTSSPNYVPGLKFYSKSHLHTTVVLSDSISGKVHANQINANIDTNVEEVIFKKFPGHTADEISHYAAKPLTYIKPKRVIIFAGTNDIAREVHRGRTVNEYQVVESLMKTARLARDMGAEAVYISAVLVRHGYQYKNPVARVNSLLEASCGIEGFRFMDQSDISSSHISTDGVHPNFYGATLLKMNILNCFLTFNPYLCDFEQDYERSLF